MKIGVKDIQKPLQQEKLTPPQLQQLASKARGVCETLEEIEYMLKLNTVAKADKTQEFADIFQNAIDHITERQSGRG